jgi:aminoglycoside phosphotransferase (APT) family kinase protein
MPLGTDGMQGVRGSSPLSSPQLHRAWPPDLQFCVGKDSQRSGRCAIGVHEAIARRAEPYIHRVKPPGRLFAAGRDADIFEYGAHSVLRRSRAGRSLADEARIMSYLAEHAYPVPTVEEVSDDGCDLVLQRIDGPPMVEVLGRQPWTVRRQGAVLAQLHHQLHEIPAPEFLPSAPIGDGGSILHLDLHPLNVLMSSAGPIVIDWTSACVGEPEADVALAWLLMSAGEIPGGRLKPKLLGLGRTLLTTSFASHFDRRQLAQRMNAVATWKATDQNLSASEVESLWRAVALAETWK